MTRRTQPVEIAVPDPDEPDAPILPIMADDAARRARAIAGAIDRAGVELAARPDVWRFEAELRRAIRDLTDLADDVVTWRAQRDAEVARGAQ